MSEQRINITQGEFATGNAQDVVITTLLGSCVSCCLWDPVAEVGGMNHMLLAVSDTSNGMSNLAGVNAMELLINSLIKLGADRKRLKAKAFGGARMVSGLSDIGRKNSEFALDFLQREGIECVSHSLGGTQSRNVKFWPASGKALQRQTHVEIIETPQPKSAEADGNGVELF